MPTLRQRIRKQILQIDGVLESDAIFDPEEPAFFVNATQMANFWGDDRLAIRLTRQAISQRRSELKADERVDLHRSGSDWIMVSFSSVADLAFVAELVVLAAEQYRPPPGVAPKLPPQGADLARRRRFH